MTMLFSNFISSTKMDANPLGDGPDELGSLGGSLEYLDGATGGSISKLRGWIRGRATAPKPATPPANPINRRRSRSRGLRQRLLVAQTASGPIKRQTGQKLSNRTEQTQKKQQQQPLDSNVIISSGQPEVEQNNVAKSQQTTDWQLERKYTLEEVQQHSSLEDCWMVIFDKVYDITEFVDEHPGGEFILLEYAGRDATHPFLSSRHGSSAYKMLDKYWIGILVDEELYYSNNSSYCSVYSNLSWRSTPPTTPPESDISSSSSSSGISSKSGNSDSSSASVTLPNLVIDPTSDSTREDDSNQEEIKTPTEINNEPMLLPNKPSLANSPTSGLIELQKVPTTIQERENEQERQLDEHLADITTTIYELFNIKPYDSDDDDSETNSQFTEDDDDNEQDNRKGDGGDDTDSNSLQEQIAADRSRHEVDQQRELEAVEADEDDDDRCSPGLA